MANYVLAIKYECKGKRNQYAKSLEIILEPSPTNSETAASYSTDQSDKANDHSDSDSLLSVDSIKADSMIEGDIVHADGELETTLCIGYPEKSKLVGYDDQYDQGYDDDCDDDIDDMDCDDDYDGYGEYDEMDFFGHKMLKKSRSYSRIRYKNPKPRQPHSSRLYMKTRDLSRLGHTPEERCHYLKFHKPKQDMPLHPSLKVNKEKNQNFLDISVFREIPKSAIQAPTTTNTKTAVDPYERDLQRAIQQSMTTPSYVTTRTSRTVVATIHSEPVLPCGLTQSQILAIQQREITPEDYELLLMLDSQIAPKTVEKRLVERIPLVTISEEGCVCTICLLDMPMGSKVKKLGCGHCYHSECIDQWLLHSSKKCPIDNLEIEAGI